MLDFCPRRWHPHLQCNIGINWHQSRNHLRRDGTCMAQVEMSIINHMWNNWKMHWTAAFAETCDINQMTAGNLAFAHQAATKAEQAAHMVTSLNNLSNVAIQKKTTLSKSLSPKTNDRKMQVEGRGVAEVGE
jgi:hypothetical protein